ncbi:MAG TPA: ATP-binding protein [Solirubrobacterales bacterium]|nr:ATP-binding protein [Solirubrobacterales bacterium]
MFLELAEVAAGLPMAASFAVVGGITTLREGRRRASLNEAMHELRRPLQVLALALPSDSRRGEVCESSLQVATAALERLDREINGRPVAQAPQSVALQPVVEAAIGRWKLPAMLRGRGLRLLWEATDSHLFSDEIELVQALDNLISNAIEHGAGEVTLAVRESKGKLCFVVCDEGGGGGASTVRRWGGLRDRISGRRRHGHGLRVVARTARAHGGGFELRRSAQRTEARLELPLPAMGSR